MKLIKKFWLWYDANPVFNTGVASFLFTLQLVHLYWMTTHVLAIKILGESLFDPSISFETLITLVDYVEIPAILTTSLIYINGFRKKTNFKDLLFLILLNSQWLHIFWITDEYVLDRFTGHLGGTLLPIWLVWTAILIDYLELPIIFDTLKRFFESLKKEGLKKAFEEVKE